MRPSPFTPAAPRITGAADSPHTVYAVVRPVRRYADRSELNLVAPGLVLTDMFFSQVVEVIAAVERDKRLNQREVKQALGELKSFYKRDSRSLNAMLCEPDVFADIADAFEEKVRAEFEAAREAFMETHLRRDPQRAELRTVLDLASVMGAGAMKFCAELYKATPLASKVDPTAVMMRLAKLRHFIEKSIGGDYSSFRDDKPVAAARAWADKTRDLDVFCQVYDVVTQQ
jgi:hypothetical protein